MEAALSCKGCSSASRIPLELVGNSQSRALLEEIRARLAKVTSPFRSAERFNVEDIIDPRDTRPLLCEFAGLAWRRLESEF
jgi:propionyl-CoA carboxylase beta chain